MNFCDITYLFFHVLYGILLTVLYSLGDILHFIIPRKLKSVKGEIVLITGAGRGIGRRLALNFGRRQAFVVCWDKNAENNQNTVWDIRQEGGQAIGFKVDVTDREAVLHTATLVQQQVGHVTILVNNAGIYPVKAILDFTPEELYDMLNTNLMAHYWTLKAFLPAMLERNTGHVVAMSSAAAIAPVAHEVPYSATKSAVSGLMEGLVQELRLLQNRNIKVTCVHPYYTASRNDLPVKFDLRIGRMSPDYVAREIVKGILQEREAISVPGFMLFWICFLRCLPQSARKVWREIFYTRVYPEPLVENKEDRPESCSVAIDTDNKIRKSNRSIMTTSDEINKVHSNSSETSSPAEDTSNPVRILNMLNQDGKTSPSLAIRTENFTKIEGVFPQNNTALSNNSEEKQDEEEMSKL